MVGDELGWGWKGRREKEEENREKNGQATYYVNDTIPNRAARSQKVKVAERRSSVIGAAPLLLDSARSAQASMANKQLGEMEG